MQKRQDRFDEGGVFLRETSDGTDRLIEDYLPEASEPIFEDTEDCALASHRPPVDKSLFTVLSYRTSTREYGPRKLSGQELGCLLFAAYGNLSANDPFKTVPSAGALHPLNVYFMLPSRIGSLSRGVYHYRGNVHAAELLSDKPVSKAELLNAFAGQEMVTQVPLIVVWSFNPHDPVRKYGVRGYRYGLIEAGHSAQNLALMAESNSLGSCQITGMDDEKVAELFHVRDEEYVVYASVVGQPKTP